jgi:hypothetical protein
MARGPTAEQLLRGQFGLLAGMPCWQVTQGYGSFITMEFGQPRLEIREPVPRARHAALRRRTVTVRGGHHLWIEQCSWKILEDTREIAHSESSRDDIAKALARIDGQILQELRVQPSNGTCTLGFEHRMLIVLSRFRDWRDGDQMLSLHAPETVLTLCAGGRLEFGSAIEARSRSVRCRDLRLRFELR